MVVAIQKLLTEDDHRKELAKKNFVAANGLPMADIADWYVMHFENLISKGRK